MAEKTKSTAYIVNHSHWDREWRYPMWQTRFMLVEFMDELIENLESGKYETFLMDGQVAPLLDYLEIRPEKKEQLEKLVSAGKIEIGPWYILPDEFPVDGEALVRNLLWGDRLSKELGACLNVGYTSFGWGQTAQLPQIYSGFGMNTAFIGKRVSQERAPKSEFLWRAPDGSQLLTSRFGGWGRQNFYFYIHLTSLFGLDHLGTDWCYNWDQDAIIYHRADQASHEQDMFRLDPPETWHPECITAERVDEVWATTDESVLAEDRLMMNGCDYGASQKFLPEMIQRIRDVDSNKDRVWKQVSLTGFTKMMQEKIDPQSLSVVKGELRDGPAAYVTGNALMTRNYLKFLNKKAQNLLIRFAEPFSVMASMQGDEFPEKIVQLSWKKLMESHPHDSINGVTQDATADAVRSRLEESIEQSEAIGDQALKGLVKNIDMSNFDKNDVVIAVFNPMPYERRETVEAWISMPTKHAHNEFIMPSSEGMQLFDSQDNPVGTQWISAKEHVSSIQEVHTRTFPFYGKRHRVVFDAGTIPAGGYKLFRAGHEGESRKDVAYADLWSRTDDILTAPDSMENEHLAVRFNSNGTFDLTDKETSRTFSNLNYYEDAAEHGDYWANKRAMNVQTHNSLCCNGRLWAEESGPLQATIVSEVTMPLPSASVKDEERRGDALVDLVIRTRVTLKAGSRQVAVRVEFENCHKDHTLRVMLPTGLEKARSVHAGNHFNVEERAIYPKGPEKGSYWVDMARLPHDKFVDISDGEAGLAVLNNCLVEYEVSNTSRRVLGLTLLRAVRNGVCTEMRSWTHFDEQDGGQCLGKHVVNYAIRPHKGNWEDGDVALHADLFNAPVCPVQTRQHDGKLPACQASLIEVTNNKIRFSALKKSQDRDTYILRLYNPTDTEQGCSIVFGALLANAWLCDLNEERQQEIDVLENRIQGVFEPKKIKTIEFEIRSIPRSGE